MRHFFESLEREIDFNQEYIKLENIMYEQVYAGDIYVNYWIERNFRKWKNRRNYTSFEELREHMGFVVKKKVHSLEPVVCINKVDMNGYFLYCEMLYNIFFDLNSIMIIPEGIQQRIDSIKETMRYNIEKTGFEIKMIENEHIIVEKNPVAIEVADIVPNLSESIIEYNGYLLRGNLERKREILKKIADALEPKKSKFEKINKKSDYDNFTFMVNNMNIRHNNCDPNGNNFREKFAELDLKEKELWYDKIYSQALFLFVLLDYQDRKKDIEEFKRTIADKSK